MNKTLIVIDAQEDFTRGALRNEDAIRALPVIHSVVEYANKNSFDGIYYTMDTHNNFYHRTQEGKNLPIAHCIYQTKGWKLCPEVQTENDHIIIMKDSFGTLEWQEWAEELRHTNEIIVCGFCTDICVISNVLILKALCSETPITVIENACAGITPEKHDAAIEVMKSCQIKIERWGM